jgi:hypothetical protein
MKSRAAPNLTVNALFSSLGRPILLRETIRKPFDLLRAMKTHGNLARATPQLSGWPTGARQLPTR